MAQPTDDIAVSQTDILLRKLNAAGRNIGLVQKKQLVRQFAKGLGLTQPAASSLKVSKAKKAS